MVNTQIERLSRAASLTVFECSNIRINYHHIIYALQFINILSNILIFSFSIIFILLKIIRFCIKLCTHVYGNVYIVITICVLTYFSYNGNFSNDINMTGKYRNFSSLL